jgi:hypothetical protein
MRTPQWDMMNAIVAYLQSSIRGDTDLQAEFDVPSPGDLILGTVYPCRVFDEATNGLAFYLTDYPVMGIYPLNEESTVVDGMAGMRMEFGVQYALKGQVGDTSTMGTDKGWPSHPKMGYILSNVWWKVRDYLQHPAQLLSDYRIESMYMDRVRFLPPLEDGIYAFEATGVMEYPYAPWKEAVTPTPFDAHYGTITETNDDRGDYVTYADEPARPWSQE